MNLAILRGFGRGNSSAVLRTGHPGLHLIERNGKSGPFEFLIAPTIFADVRAGRLHDVVLLRSDSGRPGNVVQSEQLANRARRDRVGTSLLVTKLHE